MNSRSELIQSKNFYHPFSVGGTLALPNAKSSHCYLDWISCQFLFFMWPSEPTYTHSTYQHSQPKSQFHTMKRLFWGHIFVVSMSLTKTRVGKHSLIKIVQSQSSIELWLWRKNQSHWEEGLWLSKHSHDKRLCECDCPVLTRSITHSQFSK